MGEWLMAATAGALEAIERLLSAKVNAASNEHGCRINFFVEIARGNYAPIFLRGHYTDRAGFAGEINFAVPGHGRGEIIAKARDPFLLEQMAAGGIQFCDNASLFDHPKDAVVKDGRGHIRHTSAMLPQHDAFGKFAAPTRFERQHRILRAMKDR